MTWGIFLLNKTPNPYSLLTDDQVDWNTNQR